MAGHEILDNGSDYGSDFSPEDELLLIQLVSEQSRPYPSTAVVDTPAAPTDSIARLDALPGQTDAISHHESSKFTRQGVFDGLQATQAVSHESSSCFPESIIPVSLDANVTYPNLSRALTEIESLQGKEDSVANAQAVESDSHEDDRSPLSRFRSFPKRPLTVTDLTAGAWCELQYSYTLTKLPGGRRTITAAMKGGSKIHRKLEDEVHTTIQVDVLTKEDGFALRLWNFIQGLRTLRETGLTRELEVWGIVEGNFVNGVIDAVSHQNPNPDFEEELVEQTQRHPKQTSLTDFFVLDVKSSQNTAFPKVYLADVKTRGSLAPITKPLLRPAKIQLMLYHRFISQIAAGKLDFLKLFRRYGLDADATLSDGFIAQMGDLHDEVFHDCSLSEFDANGDGESQGSEVADEGDFTSHEQLKYQTLRELANLVKEEVKLTFPEGEASMGQMLRVQYVHRDDGREIDIHDFPVSSQVLDGYLKRYMRWWQGERKAVGVDIEEAFKCKACEFTEKCSWRNAMVEERMQKAGDIVSARRKAGESLVS